MMRYIIIISSLLLFSTHFMCSGSSSENNPSTSRVIYDGNGSTGGSVPVDSTEYEENETVTVLGNNENLVKTYGSFNGWNTSADGSGTGYLGGETFSMGTSDITLYAQWNIKFDFEDSAMPSELNPAATYSSWSVVDTSGHADPGNLAAYLMTSVSSGTLTYTSSSCIDNITIIWKGVAAIGTPNFHVDVDGATEFTAASYTGNWTTTSIDVTYATHTVVFNFSADEDFYWYVEEITFTSTP